MRAQQPDLQERLVAAFAAIKRKRVVVAFRVPGQSFYAAVSDDTEPQSNPAEWTFPTGCITKLFVEALVDEALSLNLIGINDAASRYLGDTSLAEVLAHVTIKHLLEHTHGLDDSGISSVLLREDGCVDVATLLAGLGEEKLGSPGEIYSYSHVGAWIAAAILETLHGVPFEEQLGRRLFEPIGMRVQRHAPSLLPGFAGNVCAAAGASLAVSAADMMKFLDRTLSRAEFWPIDANEDQITPLPGWNAFEQGVYRGWKHHGENWYGHNSIWPRASVLVRLQPQLGTAVLVASRDHPATVVAAKLFADVLPEYFNLAFPKLLPTGRDFDLQRYCGQYQSVAQSLSIERRDKRELRLIGPDIDSVLLPATNDIFFPRPATLGEFSFVQFVRPEGSGFRYLWNGSRVFRARGR